MKNIITHTFLRKKHVLLCCEKMKLKGNWDLSKVWFSFSFSFFPILRKFDTSNVRFHLFYRNFHHPLQGRLSLLISKSVLHNFAEKYTKISVFSDYADTLMTYINFLCTIISGSSLRRLFFVILINSALMSPW